MLSVVILGALSVVIAQGFTPLFDDLSRNARILLAAVVIGALGTYLAHRRRTPAAIWTVPAILPLLPAPATLLPLLAATDKAAEQALQGQALETAFAIGVGVASGSIIVRDLPAVPRPVSSSRSWTQYPTDCPGTSAVPPNAGRAGFEES